MAAVVGFTPARTPGPGPGFEPRLLQGQDQEQGRQDNRRGCHHEAFGCAARDSVKPWFTSGGAMSALAVAT
jgi:hypothetical protein